MVLTGWRESDKGGIFGTWKGPQGSGSYAFAPSKDGSDTKKKLEEAGNKLRREKLLAMGFADWLVEQALNQTTGLEPAINWITAKLEGGNPTSAEDPEVSSEELQQLLAMGFEEEMAKQALIKHVSSHNALQLTHCRKEMWRWLPIGFLTECDTGVLYRCR